MQRVKDFLRRCKDEWNYPTIEPALVEVDLSGVTVDERACSTCKGQCCKACGCYFSPRDFEKISYSYLKEELLKGRISIAYVGKYVHRVNAYGTGVFYLRMRNKDAPIVDIENVSRKGCMLLTDKGCSFSYEERPLGAKALKPKMHIEPDGEGVMFLCRQEYSMFAVCFEWLPYKRLLRQLAVEFSDGTQKIPEK